MGWRWRWRTSAKAETRNWKLETRKQRSRFPGRSVWCISGAWEKDQPSHAGLDVGLFVFPGFASAKGAEPSWATFGGVPSGTRGGLR